MVSDIYGEAMAPDADAAWRAAHHASVELGHSWLGTEHLLLGLLAGPSDSPAVAALTGAEVTAAAVRDALTRDLRLWSGDGLRRPDRRGRAAGDGDVTPVRRGQVQ